MCVLANLIYIGAIRGYLSDEHQKIVFSKDLRRLRHACRRRPPTILFSFSQRVGVDLTVHEPHVVGRQLVSGGNCNQMFELVACLPAAPRLVCFSLARTRGSDSRVTATPSTAVLRIDAMPSATRSRIDHWLGTNYR